MLRGEALQKGDCQEHACIDIFKSASDAGCTMRIPEITSHVIKLKIGHASGNIVVYRRTKGLVATGSRLSITHQCHLQHGQSTQLCSSSLIMCERHQLQPDNCIEKKVM